MIDGWWCVVVREMTTAARRPWPLKARVGAALAMSAAVALALVLVGIRGVPALTVGPIRADVEVPAAVLRDGASAAFAALLATAAAFLLGLVPRELSGAFAAEREQGTLDGVLTTRLRAVEIVTGKLFAGLARCAAVIAAGLPLLVLVFAFGGADLGRIGLAASGVAATLFVLGALAVAVSVEARGKAKAQGQATLVAIAWLDAPFLLMILGPRTFPAAYARIAPLVDVLLASSPVSVIAHLVGMARGPSLGAVIGRMVALEVTAGVLLTAIAVVRLRPASRRLGGKAAGPSKAKPRTIGRRPPCGDDPMDWKERLAARVGWGGLALGGLAFGALFLAMAAVSFGLAWPAWGEVVVSGYASAAPDDSRWSYNHSYLRPLTGVVVFALMAVLAGTTAESLDLERKRGTWLVLLSTPLTASQILGAKQRASRRRCRPLAAALIGVWCLGTATGAVHPFGLVAALTSLAASLRFASALGAYSAVKAGGEKPGTNIALFVLVVGTILSPIPALVTGRPASLAVASASPPFVSMLGLMTWDEVRASLGEGTFGGLQALQVPPASEGAGWLAFVAVFGTALMAVASWWLDRGVVRNWDRSVGRPIRADNPT